MSAPVDAAGWKSKGNDEFSSKNYAAAAESFSRAIELDPSSHVLYSNRSAALASLGKWEEAIADADKCVALDASWAKGYIRLGAALHGAKRYSESIAKYRKGLEIEPENATLQAGLRSVESDMAAEEAAAAPAPPRENPFAKVFGPDCIQKIQANPKLAPFLLQPDYAQMIRMIVAQPQLVQQYISDKRIMQTFAVLSGLDLSFAGGDDDAAPPPTRSTPPPPKPAAKPAAAAAPPLSEAQRLKEEGNALYKAREFDAALAKYSAAAELEPTNTVFLLNRTAVIFEQGNFEECLKQCDAALEHAQEHRADYTVVAKLLTRKGSCYQKLKQYVDAVATFKKALVEHRNPETLAKLEACEKEKKQYDIESYIDPALSLKAKEEGNAFFKADKFPEAVKCYAEAIKRNPSDHALYSNRAAALIKLGAYDDAIKDCDKCLEICPTFAKAMVRKGHAYFFTKQYHKALQSYEEARRTDPENAEAAESHQRTLMKIQEQASSGDVDEEAARRAMADPEIQGILSDSYMRLVLDEMGKDPKKIQDYLRDPGIAAKLNKLIAAGVLRIGGPSTGGAAGGRK